MMCSTAPILGLTFSGSLDLWGGSGEGQPVGGYAPLFVLGTGPRLGKTLIASGLLSALGQRGVSAVGIKPVETGCDHDQDHDLVGCDGVLLRAAAPTPLPPLVASPYRFSPPVSPAVAASQAGLELSLDDLVQAVRVAQTHGRTVVEGPGGPLCPLTQDGSTVDLAARLEASVLVVGQDRPGGDGEVLLTLEACRSRGVDVRGVLLSRRDADAGEWCNDEMILARAGVPLFATLPTLENDRVHHCRVHLEAHGVVDALLR